MRAFLIIIYYIVKFDFFQWKNDNSIKKMLPALVSIARKKAEPALKAGRKAQAPEKIRRLKVVYEII